MPEAENAMTRQNILGRYRIVFFAIVVLSSGVAMVAVSSYFLAGTSQCTNSKQELFHPGTVLAVSCTFMHDVGQDLTFKAYFYASDAIKLPAHLEITDPNKQVLYDMDFDEKTIISFRPQMHGTYTATITSLMVEKHPVYKDNTFLFYGFGFLTDHPDVNNPLGDAFNAMRPVGYLVITFGAIFLIISAVKAASGRHNSLVFDQ